MTQREKKETTKQPSVFPLGKAQKDRLEDLIDMTQEGMPYMPHALQCKYIGLVINEAHQDNGLRDRMYGIVKTMHTLSQLANTPDGVDVFHEDISSGVNTLFGIYTIFFQITQAPCLAME